MSNKTRVGYKEVKIGPTKKKIPKSWKVNSLTDVGLFINGKAFNSKDWTNKGLPIIRIQNLNSMEAEFNYYDGNIEDKYLINNGDILLSWSASLGTYKWNRGKGVLNQHIFKVEPKDNVYKEFLYQSLLRSVEKLIQKTHGSTMKHIRKKELDLTFFPLPPLPEQEKIASILSTVDEKIEKIDQIIKKTKELKKGMMQQLLTKGIGHSEFKEIRLGIKKYKLPSKWNVEILDNLINLKNGKFNPKKNLNNDFSIPVYGGNGITGYFDSFLIDKPTIIIGRVGEYCGSIHYTTEKCWVTDNAIYVEDIKMHNQVDMEFIALYLKFKNLNKLSNRTGQPKLTQSRISSVDIPLPPIEEQKKIADILSTIDQKIQKKEEEKEKMETLKKGLMQKLLTGQVRVKV